MLLGLAAVARSGKDEAAKALIADGWQRRAFADRLRQMLYALNPLMPSGYRLQHLVNAYGWEYAKVEPEVRALLQRLGTDAGRQVLGEDVWVDAALRDLPDDQHVVFTDCRFRNEADAIRERGGLVVQIVRPGVDAVNGHISERALVESGFRFDAVLVNDGSIEQLHASIRRLAAGDASPPAPQA
jgi:hypothetical protein